MKRIVALVLAVIMSLSVPSLAVFACTLKYDPLNAAAGLGFSVHMPGDGSVSGGGADILDDADFYDFGARTLGTDTITINIPIRYQNFEYWDDVTGQYVDGNIASNAGPERIDRDVMNNMRLRFTDAETAAIFREPHKVHFEGNQEAKFMLIAERIGVASGYVYVEFYHDDRTVTHSKYYKIDGRVIDPTINKSIVGLTGKNLTDLETQVNGKVQNINTAKEDITRLGEMAPDSYVAFKLNTEFFVWEPLIDGMDTSVRKSTLETSRIGVKIRVAEGKNLIESAELENINGVAYVVVRFVEHLVSTSERDFDFFVYLTFRGKQDLASAVRITGSLINEDVYVDENTEYVYMGDGLVVNADSSVKNIEMDLGNGMSVFRNLYESKKYYGITNTDPTDNDYDIMDAYPAIRRVLNVKAVNVDTVGNIVHLSLTEEDYSLMDEEVPPVPIDYYIYDVDGQYLGMMSEPLPFRTKYYFATQNLSLDVSILGNGLDGLEEEWSNVASGGDDLGTSNANQNPSTGAPISRGQ